MKIIGIRPSSFTGDGKTEISGKNIYLTYPLEKGEGQGSERIFVTDAKLSRFENDGGRWQKAADRSG